MRPRSVAKHVARRLLGDERWNDFRLRRNSHSLGWLVKHFGSDKTGPPGTHRYTQHYQKFFEPLRDRRMVVLEIGIGGYAKAGKGGGSLRAWKQFFPHAVIVGLDLEDKKFVEEDRIRVYQGDQSDAAVLHRIVEEVGRPRIVIDDGSHFSHHVRASFAVLFPLLETGGYYCIEDVQTSYWPEWHGSDDRHSATTTMAMVKDLIDGLNYEEFVDENYQPTYTDLNVTEIHCFHNLVVIRKGRNAEGTDKKRILRSRYGAAGPSRPPSSPG
jgi:hypothetical protein